MAIPISIQALNIAHRELNSKLGLLCILCGFSTPERGVVVNMNEIAERLLNIRRRIAAAETKFARTPGSVGLLAVSKRKPREDLLCAHEAGQKAFGENHLQEAVEKIETLQAVDLEWHFIGPIQSNKTRPIARYFDWAHGIDRLKVATRLNEQREAGMPALNVCIQVNVSDEPTKSGVLLSEVPELARAIVEMPKLKLRGLMAIPRAQSDFEAQRAPFRELHAALTDLNDHGHTLDTLSMGMTDDMEAAIAEGATIVRIGTAIFGARES